MSNNMNKHRHNKPVRTEPYQKHNSSKWQQIVVGASSAAGTTAAIISEESMKCLKYCLYWLQYAIQHIEQQMTLIKNYLVSAAQSNRLLATPHQRTTSHQRSSVLSSIKRDIVHTLRKVVEVISKYAGASLPSQARQTVRGFILNLPERWATLNDIHSTTTSPALSPMLLPTSTLSSPGPGTPDHNKQEEAAIKLLTFGQESIEMLNSVETIFSDTVDRAELWIDRLKMVPGINSSSTTTAEIPEDVKLPPIRNLKLDH
ncbi:uncharacterized protein RHIMIDRAFT_249647 [Rhizopus microsporus ATCC 52813]|uniref:Opi1-domain-containing protein n=2 Tax=Rhizopus microsporus TaxID=58291 RepID=A0A2G4T132_RHIZD|nr:uncharacterized protein RHIMIDRAFT_249647 [Rhizopus microsporus ATCC 52813]PHZ14719.1 hypothetical protein RHIMIDRAFT_249647 [Rhizopus microsporus ATCC 52813]